ncbi:TetR/AcrR family transcriptional regulator [Nonomuraea sp. NPDC005501]|uniref:TetR/AcrR family transcriptional regulator n=1 Tax=Nonomuraea sp. NPDC005501 TaxID=3156884 RepID=UPI0033AA9EC6
MDTRERLIESIRELLWERGYVGTSPKAIQQRSGAGQGSMYHHFRDKPQLALTAISRSAEELRTRGETVLDGPGTSLEGRRRGVRAGRRGALGLLAGHARH